MNHEPARRRPRRLPILLALLLAAAGLALWPAGTAAAHVRVIPDNPTAGGFSALTFRVPNESDTAGTVKLSVQLPTDTPFVYVSTKPVPGWTVVAKKEKLPTPYDLDGTTITEAVRTVTWTAAKGIEIAPGEYQEFSLSAGPLPEAGTVLLPATQTYSDGTVVAWDQATPASGEEPEHPAPAVEIAAATAGDDHHGSSSTETAAADAPAAESGATESDAAESTADPVARTLAGLGLAAGVAALVIALLTRRRTGSKVGA